MFQVQSLRGLCVLGVPEDLSLPNLVFGVSFPKPRILLS